MSRFLKTLLFVAIVVVITVGYTKVMARVGSGEPPRMATADRQADRILVDKSARSLELWRGGDRIAAYAISLGAAPAGHKLQEGDEKTPEGNYVIDWRNQNSIAHLSLHISYPNAKDTENARILGVSPGGNIMIHGVANGWGWLGGLQRYWDWTNGCIAITNAELREIWSLVPNGTPIVIKG